MAENKKYTPEQALQKIYHYCAYQERSHREVRNKLYSYGLWTNQVEELLSHLITEGYLNEERFAKAFAGGKFRMKKWGKLKISRELEAHGLTSKCIQVGLKEIEEEDYTASLRSLLEKKKASLSEPNAFKKKDKIARYAIMKGYESNLVWAMLQEVFAAEE